MSTPTGTIEQRDGQYVLVQTRQFRAPLLEGPRAPA